MKIAIMQPYFFPYLGYFELVKKVDLFVFFDDVNYKKGSWIARNRVIRGGHARYFSVPLKNASQNSLIKDIYIDRDAKAFKNIIPLITNDYRKYPGYPTTFGLLNKVILAGHDRISAMAIDSVSSSSEVLRIKTPFFLSSKIPYERHGSASEKIISICKYVGAASYLNLSGGRNIYDKKLFASHGIKLEFIEPRSYEYSQNTNVFVPHLSVIDLLMNSEIKARNLI